MGSNLLFVGVDVDDNSYRGSAISESTGEIFEFRSAPSAVHLTKKLKSFRDQGYLIRVCYEATYLGFSLYRALMKQGFECVVIAPSLIPELASQKVKTDRLDAEKLARYFKAGLLTAVHVPNEKDEDVRDLLRTRALFVEQSVELKNYILSLCRRMGWDYKQESQKKNHWTDHHVRWLEQKINQSEGPRARNLALLKSRLDHVLETIAKYKEIIGELASAPQYKKKVEALNCFRGLSTLSSMTIVTEIGDINRFAHPRSLTSYVGLDVVEYSSGGKERKYGISKMGNRRIRTTVVEACQLALRTPKINRSLRSRRKDVNENVVLIADRCMERLHKKGSRLLAKGKHRNKVKVACSREMLGFLWEALRAV